jgi:hypothetical protein
VPNFARFDEGELMVQFLADVREAGYTPHQQVLEARHCLRCLPTPRAASDCCGAQRCAAEMRRVYFPATGVRPKAGQDHPRPSCKVRGEEICFCRFRSLRPHAL